MPMKLIMLSVCRAGIGSSGVWALDACRHCCAAVVGRHAMHQQWCSGCSQRKERPLVRRLGSGRGGGSGDNATGPPTFDSCHICLVV